MQKVKQKIIDRMGDSVRVEINKVRTIEKTASGKLRSTISKIPFPF